MRSPIAALPIIIALIVATLAPPWARCAAQADLYVQKASVTHDGRSIYIQAQALDYSTDPPTPIDPGVYGAVDWVPGWKNGYTAHVKFARAGVGHTIQVVFTGASVVNDGTSMWWNIYALVPSETDIILPGDAPTLTFNTGWLADDQGNAIVGVTDHAMDNFSLVDNHGFLDESALSFDATLLGNV